MEIEELAKVIYDDAGPAKIGIELEVVENDTNVETDSRYLFEFLLQIAILGVVKYGHTFQDMQRYFNKINVIIDVEVGPACTDPYCVVLNGEDGSLYAHIVSNTNTRHTGLEDLTATYYIGGSGGSGGSDDARYGNVSVGGMH